MHVRQIVIMSLFIFMCSKDNFREKKNKENKQTRKVCNLHRTKRDLFLDKFSQEKEVKKFKMKQNCGMHVHIHVGWMTKECLWLHKGYSQMTSKLI